MKSSKISSTADVVELVVTRRKSKIDEGETRWTSQKTPGNGLEQVVEGSLSLPKFNPSVSVDLFNN